MAISIHKAHSTNRKPATRPEDAVERQARRQLLFIGGLFVICTTIGYLRMGELFVSSHSVPLIGTLLGM